MPNLNEFFNKPEILHKPELEKISGIKPCSKCNKDAEEAFSGRGAYQKGDAKWKNCLVDYKEASASFTLNKDVWAKICTDTFKVSRNMHPALKVILGTDSKVRLGILEWSFIEEVITFWEENHE